MNYDKWLELEQEKADAEIDEQNGLYNRFNYSNRDIGDIEDAAHEARQERLNGDR